MTRQLDFFYFIGSLYSYFGVMRLDEAAKRAGISVRWRPFNLRAIMVEQDNVPRRNPIKLNYTWRDVERRAERHGLPYRFGVPYPVDPNLLANRVAVMAAHEGWAKELTQALYRGWFEEHMPPENPQFLAEVLTRLGKETAAVLAQADGAAVRARMDAETDVARELGIFGAPTFVWGREVFWGDDRMDDALAWAKAHPDF